ncbi:hypothetical protein M2390_001679 [Mycetocola sp. BIGb0189]|uniref:hypothetical protein n=1 Tax=Mycetocola sp. BIGb0189 TaxID=2940604 RepID=UPI00216A5A14|nr:hypothetical protein [Mycetocola sp. BIGb0189]MCS4276497.1 hypothetical protein [Mycetocola sp. BIGb0189]
MNDLLGDVLRAADPGTVHRDTPLSERALSELAAYEAAEAAGTRTPAGAHLVHAESRRPLLARRPGRTSAARTEGRPSNRPGTPRRRMGLAAGAMAAFAAVAIFVIALINPGPALASTPPLLELTPVSGTAPTLLTEMAQMQRTQPAAGSTIRAQMWSLNTSIAEDGSIESSVTEPQRSETVFAADGSVHLVLTAAPPFPGQASAGLPKPGTVLVDENFPSGQWEFPAESGPPTNVDEVGAYLAALTEDPHLSDGQTFREIASILSNFPITRAQESALLGYLATLKSITVAGQTTDRLDRTGIVFQARDRSPDFEDRLIVSPKHGQILAAETLYVGSSRTDIASPSVIDYVAWER